MAAIVLPKGVAKENRRLRDDVREERSDIHGVVP
jgi:hypothetical protein